MWLTIKVHVALLFISCSASHTENVTHSAILLLCLLHNIKLHICTITIAKAWTVLVAATCDIHVWSKGQLCWSHYETFINFDEIVTLFTALFQDKFSVATQAVFSFYCITLALLIRVLFSSFCYTVQRELLILSILPCDKHGRD